MHVLDSIFPNSCSLRDVFQLSITQDMLIEISRADHESEAEARHLKLQHVLLDGPSSIYDFSLREVPDLTRWAPSTGSRGEYMELFACISLLQMASQNPEYFELESETIAQALDSSIRCGRDIQRKTASVLAARFLEYPGMDDDRPYLAPSILLLAVYSKIDEPPVDGLIQLVEWVEKEEQLARKELGMEQAAFDSPFISSEFAGGKEMFQFWAEQILLKPLTPHPSSADSSLKKLGGRICGLRGSGTAFH